MNSANQNNKETITRRLARIEGQLRGVQKMITNGRDCREVMQQLLAIQSAVRSASLSFMQEVASDCLLNLDREDNPEAARALLDDLIHIMSKVS
jgi:DNA-binding FrmR family transcriptional regulator